VLSRHISETNNEGIVEKRSKPEFSDKIILIKEDGSENIVPDKEEELSYLEDKKPGEKLVFNSIIVPKGKIFKIVLSDGTKVWLNADTKITFPQKFLASGDTRTVVLNGEAFFEVAHNKDQPFIVKSNDLEIEVLGTRFNVSSYASGNQISTTLVEGSVKINNSQDSIAELILKPSYQAAFNKKTEKLEAFKVNTSDFTAWMDNKILFRNEAFKELILKIERGYNVNIINQIPELETERFTGEFDNENIEDIIKTFSSRLDFRYKIENKTITIYAK
jgi:ferric-dicitrate binding protein FerR (iron transport regulator)